MFPVLGAVIGGVAIVLLVMVTISIFTMILPIIFFVGVLLASIIGCWLLIKFIQSLIELEKDPLD